MYTERGKSGGVPGEKLPAAQLGTGIALHSSIQVLSFSPNVLSKLLTIRFALEAALVDDYPHHAQRVVDLLVSEGFFELLFGSSRFALGSATS